ncbi:MAG: aldo/keto reductase, partial [Solirubrobacteraceae bacterium]
MSSTRIGFGCGGLMREQSRTRRWAVLAAALDEGIKHFDVARMYGLGAAEAELGRFAKGRRDDFVIATKFGIEPSRAPGYLARIQGPARMLMARYPALRSYVKRRSGVLYQPRRYDAASARRSLETSLRELAMDYVDILLLHDPSPQDQVDVPGIGAYLEGAVTAGYIRAWGVAGELDPCLEIRQNMPD